MTSTSGHSTMFDVVGYAAMGALSGLRSMAGPALLSNRMEYVYVHNRAAPVSWIDNDGVRRFLYGLAFTEVVIDKFAMTPSRTTAISLAIRASAGGITGAAAAQADRRGWEMGALVGAVAAIASAIASRRMRAAAVRRWAIPDALFGMFEDAAVYWGGRALVRAAI